MTLLDNELFWRRAQQRMKSDLMPKAEVWDAEVVEVGSGANAGKVKVKLPGETTTTADFPWAPVTGAVPALGARVLCLTDAASRRVITSGSGTFAQNYLAGLQVSRVDDTTYMVSPGVAYVPSVGGLVTLPSSATLSPGNNGLPSTLAGAARYHVYLTDAATILCSTTDPSVPYYGSAKTMTGDNTKRYIDSLHTSDSGSRFLHTRRVGDAVRYIEIQDTGVPASSTVHNLRLVALAFGSVPFVAGANNRQVVDALAVVPRRSQEVLIRVLAPTGAAIWLDYNTPNSTSGAGLFNVPAATTWAPTWVPVDDDSKFVWQASAAPTAGNVTIDVLGYRDPII